ncbi:MAG: hypothetical protein HQL51_04810 [Magnetococcales bacterium]|nr:hypothetical protein [Magnetococcales bacterium]
MKDNPTGETLLRLAYYPFHVREVDGQPILQPAFFLSEDLLRKDRGGVSFNRREKLTETVRRIQHCCKLLEKRKSRPETACVHEARLSRDLAAALSFNELPVRLVVQDDPSAFPNCYDGNKIMANPAHALLYVETGGVLLTKSDVKEIRETLTRWVTLVQHDIPCE